MENRLIHDVLSHYPIDSPSIEFIRHNENQTYKVTDKADGTCYLLRIHQPVTPNLYGIQHTYEGLCSELQLLEAIAARTKLVVQTPLRTKSGEAIVRLTKPDEPPVCCSLLHRIDGSVLSKEDLRGEERVSELGSQVAVLHRFARDYTAGQRLVRPEYGVERNADMLDQIRYGVEIGIVGAANFEIVEETFQTINRRLDVLGKDETAWGLVHADLNMSNIIVTGRGYSFIDFCLSGYGYYMLDVGQCALNIGKHMRESFLRGYAQTYPLHKHPVKYLEGFMLLAIFGYYAFHMRNEDTHPWIRERLPILCETYCKPFIKGEEIFYGL